MNSREAGTSPSKWGNPGGGAGPPEPSTGPQRRLGYERSGGSCGQVCQVTHHRTDVREPTQAVPTTTGLGNHIPDSDLAVSGPTAETPSPSSILNCKNRSKNLRCNCLVGNNIVSHNHFH